MMQQPSTGGGASMMDQQQQQQHQPQPTTTTTSTAQEEEEEEKKEEEEDLWIGNLQNWMDKVEEKKVRTLRIGDLQHWMDEAYIDSSFSHTGGEVFTSKVIRNNKKTTTGESFKCYGFVEFKSHAIAERFLQKFDGTPMSTGTAGTNFSLNWASSSFGEGEGEGEEEEEGDDDDDDDDDDDFAAAHTVTTTDFMLPQKTFTISLEHLDPLIAKEISYEYMHAIEASSRVLGGVLGGALDAELNSSWENVFKWRRIAQGTRTLEEVHAVHRVYVIGAFLKAHHFLFERGVTLENIIQEMLDELPMYVNSIDITKEFHSIGALIPLLRKLGSQHVGIREKTAKVINTMAKNNPSSRQLVLQIDDDEGGLLYQAYFGDSNPTVETNVLDAISLLFRNNKPGIFALFRESKSFVYHSGMESTCVDFQRRTLNLIRCLVHESKSECNIVSEFGYHHNMMQLAQYSDDADVREAALRCLLELARVEEDENSAQLVQNDDELKQFLKERVEGISSAMAPEDLGAPRTEIELVDSLWNACFNNKPSPLRKKGTLV